MASNLAMRFFHLPLKSILGLVLFAAPLPAMVDRNDDGISDVWAAMHPTAGAPDADPDGDGANNRVEAVADTDPLSAASRFTATHARDADGNLMLRWNARPHKLYRIESSSDLKTWTPLPGRYSGSDTELSPIVSPAGTVTSAKQFWRIVVADIDTDGDGFSDWEEINLGTSLTEPGPILEAFERMEPTWQPLTVSGTAASGNVPAGKLVVSTANGSLAGFYHTTPFSGHFEVETEFAVDDQVALALFRKGANGQPDLANFVLIEVNTVNGTVEVSARDRQNGIADVLDNSLLAARERYRVRLLGYQGKDNLDSYSVPYRATAKKLRILRHAGENFFHLYWAVRDISGFAALGENKTGWMELAPVRGWPQLDGAFYAAVLTRNGTATFDNFRATVLPLDDQNDSTTGFRAIRREYTWSGYRGDAVVVSFGSELVEGGAARKFVFAAQNNYVPVWHLSDSLAFTYQFVEQWDGGSNGCFEPMSDRNLRFSNIQILEDNAVRKVVQWDYALVDPNYRHADFGVGTQIPQVRETYTIYPDGNILRRIRFLPKLDTSYRQWNELLELIVIAGRNTLPSEHVASPSMSLWPYSSGRVTHSPIGQYKSNPIEINGTGEISLVAHFKSAPDAFASWADQSWNTTYPGSSARLSAKISWHDIQWNFSHWPINKEKYSEWFSTSQSTQKMWREIPSHASLANLSSYESSWNQDIITVGGRKAREWVSLIGLNNPSNPDRIGKRTYSWLYPYRISNLTRCTAGAYDAATAAHNLTNTSLSALSDCSFRLSPQSSGDYQINPVFRVANWKGANIEVLVNSLPLSTSEFHTSLIGTDLLVCIRRDFSAAATIRLRAK